MNSDRNYSNTENLTLLQGNKLKSDGHELTGGDNKKFLISQNSYELNNNQSSNVYTLNYPDSGNLYMHDSQSYQLQNDHAMVANDLYNSPRKKDRKSSMSKLDISRLSMKLSKFSATIL